jgi:hypothetical protein
MFHYRQRRAYSLQQLLADTKTWTRYWLARLTPHHHHSHIHANKDTLKKFDEILKLLASSPSRNYSLVIKELLGLVKEETYNYRGKNFARGAWGFRKYAHEWLPGIKFFPCLHSNDWIASKIDPRFSWAHFEIVRNGVCPSRVFSSLPEVLHIVTKSLTGPIRKFRYGSWRRSIGSQLFSDLLPCF